MSYITYYCNAIKTGLNPSYWENINNVLDQDPNTFTSHTINQSNRFDVDESIISYYDTTSELDLDNTSYIKIYVGVTGKQDENFNDAYIYCADRTDADFIIEYEDSTSYIDADLQRLPCFGAYKILLDSTSSEYVWDVTSLFATNVNEILDKYLIISTMTMHPFIESYDLKCYISNIFWRIEI